MDTGSTVGTTAILNIKYQCEAALMSFLKPESIIRDLVIT
jgi:hypothetical protein